ncbi:MarR family transcriptional regulator [Apilactobacillus sp. TMW 2.2459]|uniref:MarR family transcriptional regulator n=1 Tax=Apilactobacillus xinyiensis TaxID=2841032 RepID=UPI00200E9F97|nr:MarR family transcriptional regulator [Apilactobacillus xinyiensis]MCL0312197.1 MarR family transcriptional regulator [Apilactobacillus xinyiensis]
MNNEKKLSTIFFAYQQFAAMIDLKKYDLTKNQHRMLYIIYALDNVSIKDILNLLNISKQAANVSLRDLISRNLITESKSPVDKRIKILNLTTEGQRLNEQINQEQIALLDEYFVAADNDWQKVMEKLADSYIHNLK